MNARERLAEKLAKAEHEGLAQYGTPGAKRKCPDALHEHIEGGIANCRSCKGTGYWIEGEWPAWEDDTEEVRQSFRVDAAEALDAFFADPSLVVEAMIEAGAMEQVAPYSEGFVNRYAEERLPLFALVAQPATGDENE